MHVIWLYGNYLVIIMFHILAQQYNTFWIRQILSSLAMIQIGLQLSFRSFSGP